MTDSTPHATRSSRLLAFLRDMLSNTRRPLLAVYAWLTIGILAVGFTGLLLVVFQDTQVVDVQRIVRQLTLFAAITLVASITVEFLSKGIAKGWVLVFGLSAIGALILPTNDLIRIALVAVHGETDFRNLFLQHDSRPRGRKEAVHERAVALHRELEEVRSGQACQVRQQCSGPDIGINRCEESMVQAIVRFLTSEDEREMLRVVEGRNLLDLLDRLRDAAERSRLLVDHAGRESFRADLYFLRAQGLVAFPYDDIGSIELTPIGRSVLRRAGIEAGPAGEVTSRGARDGVPTTISDFHREELPVGPAGNTFTFTVGRDALYTLDVVGFGDVDPLVRLLRRRGSGHDVVGEDDDSGYGLSARLSVELEQSTTYILDVSDYSRMSGTVLITLRGEPAP